MKSAFIKYAIAVTALCPLVAEASSISETAHADTLENRKIISSYGVDVRGGYLFSSGGFSGYDDAPDKKKLHSATSFHLKYSFSFDKSTYYGRNYPGAYQGLGVSVNTFYGHEAIGTPVGLYLFQGAPVKSFSERFSLLYEWNFGASFGWHLFSEEKGMEANVITGSKVNAILSLSFMMDYKLGSGFSLRAGLEGVHFSNGNTSIPNPGINSLGARVGVVYTPQHKDVCKKVATQEQEPFRRHFSYDVLLYGSAHKQLVNMSSDERVAVPGHFGVAGVSVAPMYGFNRYLRAGLSADIKYDEASNLEKYMVEGSDIENMHFYRQPLKECFMAGISARAELVMPIFSINAGVGYNMIGVGANRNFYQTLNLRTHLTHGLWINVGYQLHDFSKPDNLIIGLGYTFGR